MGATVGVGGATVSVTITGVGGGEQLTNSAIKASDAAVRVIDVEYCKPVPMLMLLSVSPIVKLRPPFRTRPLPRRKGA